MGKKKDNIIRRLKRRVEVSYEIADQITELLFDFGADKLIINKPDSNPQVISCNRKLI